MVTTKLVIIPSFKFLGYFQYLEKINNNNKKKLMPNSVYSHCVLLRINLFLVMFTEKHQGLRSGPHS